MILFAAAPHVFAQTMMNSFTENFNGTGTPSNFRFGTNRNSIQDTWTSGIASEIEPDTRVMRLAMHPDNEAEPWQGPNFESTRLTRFGRYSARIKIPGVEDQPLVGGVVGFFTYYNDEYNNELPKDENGNGLNDNSEIDFEWLIANPQLVYMTAWTDHDVSTGICRKVARIVNLATGQILTTNYVNGRLGSSGVQLTGVENQPETIRSIPEFDASKNFYTYGFDWRTDNIRWWILNPENELDTIVLWDYRENPANEERRITQKPAFLLFNFWHTNNWAAEGVRNSTQRPNRIFHAEFDWVRYETLAAIDNTTSITRENITPSKTAKIVDASIMNRQLNLSFPSSANAAKIALYDIRGRLLFERDITVMTNFASIALPKSVVRNQMVILQIKADDFNFAQRLPVKR